MSELEYRFYSKGLSSKETLTVVDFKGFESISSPYEFTINLKSESAEIDLEKILTNRCTFEMEVDGNIRKFHGVLSTFDQLHQVGKYSLYQAVLVPRLWQLSLYHTNEIYLDMSVQDIIKAVLEECGIPSLDYEINLSGSYTTWPFRCQFGETHLQFISRLMEHLGIYYFFDQGSDAEKIVFCDNLQFQKSMKNPTVNYTPVTGVDKHAVYDNIYSLVCRRNRMSKSLTLKDYNYEKPSLDVEGTATIDEKGIGEVYSYGENFDTPEEGKQLATVRAEKLGCTKEHFYGDSAIHRLIPGYFFQMEKHFRQSFNQEYMLISIEHEGKMPSHMTEKSSQSDYQNSFTAIPSGTQFRSELTTPKPRFFGTINAIIDAEQEGDYAELDEHGRYKVQFPFDRITEHAGGKASHWVRMAQPYGGSQEGMVFPLRKGTEVLLTFINGDPDQPIISAVVPNTANPSLINADSQTAGRIRTSAGNLLEMEDKEGKNRIKLFSPEGNTYMHLGASNPDGIGFVVMTTGLRRSNYLGGEQTTVLTKNNTQNIPSSVQTQLTNAGNNTAGTSPTNTTQPNIIKEQDLWKFVKREIGSGYGKSANGTKKLTRKEEISGEYITERIAGTKYSWTSGDVFKYGHANTYNFGPLLEVTHWNKNATSQSKSMVDTMRGYNLKGVTEYSGAQVVITSGPGILASSTKDSQKWKTLCNKGQLKLMEADLFLTHNGNLYNFSGWVYNFGNGYEENHISGQGRELNKKYTFDKSPAGPPNSSSYSVEHLESHNKNLNVSKTVQSPSYNYATESPSVEVSHNCDSFSYTYGGVSKEWTYTSAGTKFSYEEKNADTGSTREERYSASGGTMMCLTRTSASGQNFSTEEFKMVASSNLSLSLGATNSFTMRMAADSEIETFVGAKSKISMSASAESEIKLAAGFSSNIELKSAIAFEAKMVGGNLTTMEIEPTKIELDPWSTSVKAPGMDMKAEITALKLEKAAALRIANRTLDISQAALRLATAQSIQL
jgi:type VI secretion system secreted protein VgrG